MFRTEIEELSYSYKIDHKSGLLTIGSCFSDTIGSKLEKAKFDTLINPFGTVFNPLSIFKLLSESLNGTELDEQSILERDSLYLSHHLHTSITGETKDKLHERFVEIGKDTLTQLKKAKVLFITLGTAWVYESKESGQLVSNCHKVPQKHFTRRLLQLDEILNEFFQLKEQLDHINPELKVVLTLSPVRHTKDTLQGNAISKSLLRTACHYLSEMANNVDYFPAYEIVMDDLRDYRFFESDLIHPNEQAIDYIWTKFSTAFMNPDTLELIAEIGKVQSAIAHRAFNADSKNHQAFLARTLRRARELDKQINLNHEIKVLRSRLNND